MKCRAQEEPPQAPPPAAPVTLPEGAVPNATQSCVQPPPSVRWQDYNGPLHKALGVIARSVERESVHPPDSPRYKANTLLCSLETKEKFTLFVRDSVDPVTYVAAGFSAGISQAADWDSPLGQGAAGYGKRFGLSYIDQVQFKFFKVFAYPALFSEDPRYYRLAHGSSGKRLWHALEHSFVAYRDNGHRMFNFSELLGNASGAALGNLYHPGAQRGFAPTARQVGYSIAIDSGFDVLREFWPAFSRKFHLPFRDQNESLGSAGR